MMPIVGNASDSDNNKRRTLETEELKDDLLEKTTKRMNEVENMKNDNSIEDEVTNYLNQECYEHVVKRVKILIKDK